MRLVWYMWTWPQSEGYSPFSACWMHGLHVVECQYVSYRDRDFEIVILKTLEYIISIIIYYMKLMIISIKD